MLYHTKVFISALVAIAFYSGLCLFLWQRYRAAHERRDRHSLARRRLRIMRVYKTR
jgi:hypothetical protein